MRLLLAAILGVTLVSDPLDRPLGHVTTRQWLESIYWRPTSLGWSGSVSGLIATRSPAQNQQYGFRIMELYDSAVPFYLTVPAHGGEEAQLRAAAGMVGMLRNTQVLLPLQLEGIDGGFAVGRVWEDQGGQSPAWLAVLAAVRGVGPDVDLSKYDTPGCGTQSSADRANQLHVIWPVAYWTAFPAKLIAPLPKWGNHPGNDEISDWVQHVANLSPDQWGKICHGQMKPPALWVGPTNAELVYWSNSQWCSNGSLIGAIASALQRRAAGQDYHSPNNFKVRSFWSTAWSDVKTVANFADKVWTYVGMPIATAVAGVLLPGLGAAIVQGANLAGHLVASAADKLGNDLWQPGAVNSPKLTSQEQAALRQLAQIKAGAAAGDPHAIQMRQAILAVDAIKRSIHGAVSSHLQQSAGAPARRQPIVMNVYSGARRRRTFA